MAHVNKIRSLIDQSNMLFGGSVEMDEGYFGGKDQWKHASKRGDRRGTVEKTPVLGMAQLGTKERRGKVIARNADWSGATDLLPHVHARVLPQSTVYTDEWRAYNELGERGYDHERANHSQKVYVSGNVHTNTIDGFWATVKRGIGGTYHSVSTNHSMFSSPSLWRFSYWLAPHDFADRTWEHVARWLV